MMPQCVEVVEKYSRSGVQKQFRYLDSPLCFPYLLRTILALWMRDTPVVLYLLAGASGYLLGSLPSAYLLVRRRTGIDIRRAGSGNVGALNSFEVTGQRWIGVAVLLADVGKGMAAVWCARLLGADFAQACVAGCAAVFGHLFPVWLRFRGGRGLATAAGAMMLIWPPFVLLWCGLWCLAMSALRTVNPASAAASMTAATLGALVPAEAVDRLVPPGATLTELRLFVVTTMILVLLRLVGPALAFLASRRVREPVNKE
jgi:glycerol-3-phosphate acyltransferase PlsY